MISLVDFFVAFLWFFTRCYYLSAAFDQWYFQSVWGDWNNSNAPQSVGIRQRSTDQCREYFAFSRSWISVVYFEFDVKSIFAFETLSFDRDAFLLISYMCFFSASAKRLRNSSFVCWLGCLSRTRCTSALRLGIIGVKMHRWRCSCSTSFELGYNSACKTHFESITIDRCINFETTKTDCSERERSVSLSPSLVSVSWCVANVKRGTQKGYLTFFRRVSACAVVCWNRPFH